MVKSNVAFLGNAYPLLFPITAVVVRMGAQIPREACYCQVANIDLAFKMDDCRTGGQ